MRSLVLVVVGLAAGCPPAQPGPEEAAAYLGLAADTTLSFVDQNNLTRTIDVKPSSIIVDESLVFDLFAKDGGGFIDQDLTFTMAVGVEDVLIARFGDCITECRQPNANIPFMTVPLKSGAFVETEVDVDVTEGAQAVGVVPEKHSFTVGEEAPVTVPAGTFDAFSVAWTRTIDGDIQTAVVKIVAGALCTEDTAERDCGGGACVAGQCANTGIVAWDGFDGTSMQRQ